MNRVTLNDNIRIEPYCARNELWFAGLLGLRAVLFKNQKAAVSLEGLESPGLFTGKQL